MRFSITQLLKKEKNMGFIFILLLVFLINTSLFAQDFWQKLPLYGGGVRSIAINQDGELFAGSEATGISKSSDKGDSWQQINAELYFPTVNMLTVGANGNIIAGVKHIFNEDSTSIYLSTDKGNSWNKIYDCLLDDDVTAMVVTSNGNIFIAIYNELYYTNKIIKSTNNGATWIEVSIPNLYGTVECLEVNSLDHVYAGAEEGIYRSVDYGENWINISVNYYLYSVQAMEISGQGLIFAGLGSGQIYRSINSGETWEPVYNGSYDTEFEAISINSNGIIFAGINFTYGEDDSSYILHSLDNGQNWVLNYSFSNTRINTIESDSTGSVFVGTDFSIYRSSDNGTSWNEVTNGLTNYVAQNFAFNSLGHAFMGSYGIPVSYTSDLGENWTKFNNLGNIWSQGLAINPNDHIFVCTEKGIFRSTDNGANWTTVFPDSTYFMGISIRSDGYIFAGTYEDGVFRSIDNGGSWTAINNGLIYGKGIRPIVFDANGYVYAGADSGGVFFSANNGDTWTSVSNGLPDEEIHSLAINSSGDIFAGTIKDIQSTFTGGVYRSMDGGQYWESVNTGLTGSGVTAIIINSLGHIYAATIEDGVFKSTDNGANWSAVNTGLTNLAVWPMGIDKDGYLYAGTFSGVFRSVRSINTTASVDVEPDTAATAGKDLTISVTPSEDFQPTSRILYYRYSGESSWRQIQLETTEEVLNFTIPSDSVSYRGIEYYVELSDGLKVVTYPENDPLEKPARIQVAVERQVAPLNFSSLTYKMVSVPIQLESTEIDSVLADDYNSYDIKYWRVLRYQTYPDTGYYEHAHIDSVYSRGIDSTFTPGNAFWLITRSGERFDVENGLSINSAEPFNYSLQPGWNQVGNPFAFTIAVSSISNADSLDAPVYYDGTEYQYDQQFLKPWEGYFVYNRSSEVVTISIPPVEATAEGIPKIKNKCEIINENGYLLQISAKMKNTKLIDTQNYIGLSRLALDDNDKFDLFEAPPIGDYLQVSIIEKKDKFASNFKSASELGQQWDLEICLSEYIDKPIEITLSEFGELPENFKLFVLDKNYVSAIPIKNNKFSIEITKEFPIRKLKFIIGTDEFAQQHNEEIPLVPIKYKLKQNYPNPFNSGTIIQYQLGKRTLVELTIFDVLGRRVRGLIDEKQTTGFHTIHWDGLNESGIKVASGIYFYRLKAGDFADTKKVLLVR